MNLASQQRRLLQTLNHVPLPAQAAGPWLGNTHAGLLAYQANAHAVAERALDAAYPALALMLGAASLRALARAFWHARPPRLGDLNRWGDGLADFIARSPQLADAPYLADVARLEWALHRAASAANGQPRPASFARLADTPPEQLRLRLNPGCALCVSAYPVVSLAGAHRPGLTDTPITLTQSAQALHQGQAQAAWVWRVGPVVHLRQADGAEAAALAGALAGANLAAVLDALAPMAAADQAPPPSATHAAPSLPLPPDTPARLTNPAAWLADGIRDGWLLGLSRLHG